MSFPKTLTLLVAIMASASLMAFGLLGFSEGSDSMEQGIEQKLAQNNVSFEQTHWVAIILIAITLPFVFLAMKGSGTKE